MANNKANVVGIANLEEVNQGSLERVKNFLETLSEGMERENDRLAAEFVLDYVVESLASIKMAKSRAKKDGLSV